MRNLIVNQSSVHFTLLITVLLCAPISGQTKIDLTRICHHGDEAPRCTGRTWWITEGFSAAFLTGSVRESGWTKLEPTEAHDSTFPIWVNKKLPLPKPFAVFTLTTLFDAPDELLNGVRPPGIRFGEIGETFEVYINGHLVAREGKASGGQVTLHRTVRGTVWPFNPAFLHPSDNKLTVKLQGDPRYDHTGFYLTQGYEVGFYDELMRDREDRIAWTLIALYLFTGLYHLLLYAKRRKETYNLYFGLFCVFLFVYFMTRTDIVFELPWDTLLIQRLELSVLYLLLPALFAFADMYFYGALQRVTKYYSLFCGILIPPTLVLPMHLAERLLLVFQLSMLLLGLPYLLYKFIRPALNGNRDARRLLAGALVLIATAVFDVLDSIVFNTGLAFTKYGFFVFVLGIAVILANRFLRLHNEIEGLNVDLEKKVQDRTSELRDALGIVQNLKVQQDGDYFLTSLLIKPLAANRVTSGPVSVEFLVRQKKRFDFKKWKEQEIGGDICVADTLTLRDKEHTVFLNGDAMGKSIQGAGGALVLGSVFEAIVARTRLTASMQAQYPERWLKSAFVELQTVFASFDGYMLVSLVMGLIDNQSGLLYYLNAEHPWTVLFRGGRAEFIEKETKYRKLGIPGLEGSVYVETFQLAPGDVLIAGSDGRDDLILGTDSSGGRIINEDECRFLGSVERGGADLQQIHKDVIRNGEIMDDFSLLRLGFKEKDPAQPLPLISATAAEHMRRGKAAAHNKDWNLAVTELERASEFDSQHPKVMRSLALSHYKAGNFEKRQPSRKITLSSDQMSLNSCIWPRIHTSVAVSSIAR